MDSKQAALVKLLLKLNLIEAEDAQIKEGVTLNPIAHFASQSKYDELDALKLIAAKLAIPLIRINKMNLNKILALFDHPALKKVGLERWKQNACVPYDLNDRNLLIACSNPLNHDFKSSLEFDLGCAVSVGIALEREVIDTITLKINSSEIFDLNSIIDQSEVETVENNDSNLEASVYEGDISAAPVVRLVNKIIADAILTGASDIHLTPENESLQIRIRVDGIMRPLFSVPNQLKGPVTSRLKLLSGMDIAERRKPQDGRLRIKTPGGLMDLRFSTVPTIFGENIVIRVLQSDIGHISFESLGMSEQLIARLKQNLRQSSRVVLVCGPTGSGKTSTLYSALMHLKDGTSNIITVEDPIEYRVQGIAQIQVNSKAGVSFAQGLRSILRQDPDIIMVGEIRDNETASIAMQTAQTGHLVLSTIHTNSASSVVTRLHDLGIQPFLIASSLGCILAQRLVRRLCLNCREPAQASDLKRVRDLGIHAEKVYRAKGCEDCGMSGFKGRVGIFSLLELNDSVRKGIRDGASEAQLEEYARSSGFQTLDEAALVLLQQGVTTLDEIESCLGILQVAPAKNSVAMSATPQQNVGLKRRRVLLVEDEETTRSVISMVLKSEMFEVEEAINGLEALEKVYAKVPDLIVCDIMMPKMSGLEFISKLRADKRTNQIPVIMLTAADTEENEVQAIACGANDFISKTSSAKVMMARVQRLLR